jgi:hypothetical protein
MLRYLMPYLVVSFVLLLATAVAYNGELIGVLGVYAGTFTGSLISWVGHERWLARKDRAQRG